MKSRISIRSITATVIFTIASIFAQAQSTGYINREASNSAGKLVLDPNGNRYTSATTAGFMGDDVTNSEIPYRSVPSFSREPFGDLRRGPNHLYSDFVPDANNVGYYAYFDGSNMLFRMRMGSVMPGSKGYSVMLDTDGKFGATGSNADPNFVAATTGTNGNPGFEIEIVLETNFRIAIYNVDGTSSPALTTQYTNWQEMSQVSIAGTFDNGDPDFFFDFYIPFSALQGSPFNLTSSTQIRMIATTVMSPQAAIGGPKSDIYGLDDAGYKNTNDQYEAYINTQPSVTPTGLNSGGFGSRCTAPPTVNSPISTGTVNISGTWTMSALSGAANTATITVYKNNVSVGTVSGVTSGSTWVLNNVAVASSDIITAKAQGGGESMCLLSNAVTASNCNAATRPAKPNLTCVVNGSDFNKGITGNNLATGWIVTVENMTRNTVETNTANPGQFTTSGTSPNITWNYAGGCSGGPNMPSGSYKVYYTNASGCLSEPFFFCVSGTGGNALSSSAAIVPSITSPANGVLSNGTKTIVGAGEPNSAVILYVDGVSTQTATANGSGNFTFSNLSLSNGQQVYITNVLSTGTVSTSKCLQTSAAYNVLCYTASPIINTDNNNQITAASPITGVSGEPSGTTIRVYTAGNSLVASTTVQANGTWSTGNAGTTPATYNAVSGTTYYATAQNGSCGVSVASGSAAALAATTGRCGTITGPVASSDATISGGLTGSVTGTIVNLYLDGQKVGTTTTATSTWSINTSSLTYPIYNNGVLTIGIQETGKQEQLCGASVTVSCSTGPVMPTFSPSGSSSVSSGQSKTYTINNAQTGAFYGISDAATGQSLGSGVWATSGTVALTTNTNLSSGSYTIAIKGTSLTGVSVCSSSPGTASLLVSSILPATLLDFYGRRLLNTNELTWIVEQELNVKQYEVERSSDGVSFAKVGSRSALTATGKLSYQFSDAQAPSATYYRLKIIDNDEKYAYSKIILVHNDLSVSFTAQPNPFTTEIQLKVTSDENQFAQIELINLNGQAIKTMYMELKKGINATSISLQTLKAGIYLLRLRAKGFVLQEKLLKAK